MSDIKTTLVGLSSLISSLIYMLTAMAIRSQNATKPLYHGYVPVTGIDRLEFDFSDEPADVLSVLSSG